MGRFRGAALLAVAMLVAVAPACSGGSGRTTGLATIDTRGQFCALVAQLDASGRAVARADVNNPAVFDATLDRAVAQYTKVLDRLRRVAPPNLQSNVDRLQTAVAKHHFAAGAKDHAALAAYATRRCS